MGKGMIQTPLAPGEKLDALPKGPNAIELIKRDISNKHPLVTKAELDSFSKAKLEYYYLWVRENIKRDTICGIIRRYMSENDLIYRLEI
jgi:hypothetical protein